MYKRKKALDTYVAPRAFFDSKDNKAGYRLQAWADAWVPPFFLFFALVVFLSLAVMFTDSSLRLLIVLSLKNLAISSSIFLLVIRRLDPWRLASLRR